MKILALFGLLSVVAARPGGLYDPWGGAVVAQPYVKSVAVAQPYIHAAPAVAIAKPAATSYASFQQVVNPVAVAQPVVHAPYTVAHAPYTVAHAPYTVAHAPYTVAHAPVVHSAPVYSHAVVAQPVVQAVAQPVYAQKYLSVGHGW